MVNHIELQKLEKQKEILLQSSIYEIKTPNGSLYTTNPKVFPIQGLSYIPNFLNQKEQALILSQLQQYPFSEAISRRQQFWGEVYYHTTHDLTSIQPVGTQTGLPMIEMKWLIDRLYDSQLYEQIPPTDSFSYSYHGQEMKAEPTKSGIFHCEAIYEPPYRSEDDQQDGPTQVLVNEYKGVQKISSHFDDPFAFGPLIAIVSLENPVWMHLSYGDPFAKQEKYLPSEAMSTDVLLEPGSLLIMKADARYLWKHGITRKKYLSMPIQLYDVIQGGHKHIIEFNDDEIEEAVEEENNIKHRKLQMKEMFLVERTDDYYRYSLTIRKLLAGRKKSTFDSTGWQDVSY